MQLKKTTFLFWIFISISELSYAQDTVKFKFSSVKANNFYVGILIAPAKGVLSESKPHDLPQLDILLSNADIFTEYFPLNNFSIFSNISYEYDYYKYLNNKGNVAGTIGLKYYFRIKYFDTPQGFLWQVGPTYTWRYYYNPPQISNLSNRTEIIGFNSGFSYFPERLFKKENRHILILCSITNTPKDRQSSGGFGISYKF